MRSCRPAGLTLHAAEGDALAKSPVTGDRITPQAGVNLAPLVGQDVAVRGARGYMPEYKRPYVVASEARVRIAAAPEASPDRATR